MALVHVIECDSCGKRYEGSSEKEIEQGLIRIPNVEFRVDGRARKHEEVLHFCDGTCASEWFLSRIGRLHVDA